MQLQCYIYQNSMNDIACKEISKIFYNISYPLNETKLSPNKITNLGFNHIINYIRYRSENSEKLLTYPIRLCRIKPEPILQNIFPLCSQIHNNNYVKIKDTKEYVIKIIFLFVMVH